MTGEELAATLAAVLTAVEDAAADHAVTLPDRRYVAASTPAHDCEQVTVAPVQVVAGLPGGSVRPGDRCALGNTATVSVEIVRCVPASASPSVAELAEAGAVGLADLAVLADAGRALAGTQGGASWQAQPLPPSGDLGGTRLLVTLAVHARR